MQWEGATPSSLAALALGVMEVSVEELHLVVTGVQTEVFDPVWQ